MQTFLIRIKYYKKEKDY